MMNSAQKLFTVTLGGETKTLPESEVMAYAAELNAKHGGVPQVLPCQPTVEQRAAQFPQPVLSTFEKPVVDAKAKERIDAQQAALRGAGLTGIGFKEEGGDGDQFFANGTRMMAEGYRTQSTRKAQHEATKSIHEAANELASVVKNEGREDYACTARDFANAIEVNGKITVFGHTLTEQAIRGIMNRTDSPALSYILGLRSRIQLEMSKPETSSDPKVEARNSAALRADRQKIAAVLHHECKRNGDRTLKLRARKNPGDIFAVVSPDYAPADAPEVIAQAISQLPKDAKGTWSYDAHSTQWELRANVWTPTPVDEQAVGEAFTGYLSLRARDNGTSKFRGGGGIEFLRCLNASTYVADGSVVDRVHRGRIMYDIAAMLEEASASIHVLCQAWGENSKLAIEVPEFVDEKPMTLEQAIPGLYRHMLNDRRELAGVLAGRTEKHVEGLTRAYASERRNPNVIVRSDLGQGFTRYIQDLPVHTRIDAEAAIGDWVVSPRPLRFDLRNA